MLEISNRIKPALKPSLKNAPIYNNMYEYSYWFMSIRLFVETVLPDQIWQSIGGKSGSSG